MTRGANVSGEVSPALTLSPAPFRSHAELWMAAKCSGSSEVKVQVGFSVDLHAETHKFVQ
jgi:hypothetical protein